MPGKEQSSGYQPPIESPPERRKRDHKRPDRVAEYVSGLLAEYEARERDYLPSPRELATQFGYSNTSGFYHTLRNRGLFVEVERVYKETNVVYPSTEWAWMLGIISLGGSTSPQNQQISLVSADSNLLNAFSLRGANLFHTNPSIMLNSTQSDGRKSRKIYFGNGYMVRAIGDLRKESWPDTISERHGWIYEDNEYIWSFLEGACEVRGYVSNKPRKRRITINSNFKPVANTIADLLVRVGVENPHIKTDSSAREGIRGVDVSKSLDVKHMARHIHSVNQNREKILQELRELDIKPPARVNSLEEVVREWTRLRNMLGRAPNSSDIPRLKKSGETPYSTKVYIGRSPKGTWVDAVRFFEELSLTSE